MGETESESSSWVREKLIGELGSERHGFSMMIPHSAGACSSWSIPSMLSVL